MLAKLGQIYEPAGLPGTALTTDINITALRGGCVTWGSRDGNPNTVESEEELSQAASTKDAFARRRGFLLLVPLSPSRRETSRDTAATVVTTPRLVNYLILHVSW